MRPRSTEILPQQFQPPSVLDNLPQNSVLVLHLLIAIKLQFLVATLIISYIKWKN